MTQITSEMGRYRSTLILITHYENKGYTRLHPKNVTIPAPFMAQSCTPAKSKFATHKGAINQLKVPPVRVLVCTRLSVHPSDSECKSAPVLYLYSVQGNRGAEKCFYDCYYYNMNIWGSNVHPHQKRCRFTPQR